MKKALLIDISNSNTKLALVNLSRRRQASSSLGGEGFCKILPQIATPKISKKKIARIVKSEKVGKIILCSVVPQKTKIFTKNFSKILTELNHKNCLDIDIKYPKPKNIGADRLANTIAAVHSQKIFPAIIIDFGTAVTFDIIDAEGSFIGGVICPGIDVMTNYLRERTALLPQIKLKPLKKNNIAKSVIGKSTKHAMLAGAYHGYRGMIRTILKKIKQEMQHKKLSGGSNKKIHVTATGSYSRIILQNLRSVNEIDELLTLKGLHQIAKSL